jgi:enterochelin esterase-like enzyme
MRRVPRAYNSFVRLRLVAAAIVVIGGIAFWSTTTRAPEEDRTARPQAQAIENGTMAVPVVTASDITFYAEADGTTPPRLVSDLTGWGERPDGTFDFNVGQMRRLSGTNWYSLTARAAATARIEYLFAYGAGDYRLDPRNPRRAERVGGPASEVVMPGYQPPPDFDAEADPARPGGRVTEADVSGAIVGRRHVIVYTPPGYVATHQYRLAVFHDGGLVVNTGHAPRVLDWLIAHEEIPPIVAAFVEPVSRADDYRRDAPMRDFVATELMAWLGSHYSITPLAADHAIVGISAGARGAVDTLTAYPAVFGRSALIIPALTADDAQHIPVRRGEEAQLDVVILAATYDRLNAPAASMLREAFQSRGHSVRLIEVAEGHSTLTWKLHLRDVLVRLFGR